MYDDDVSRLEQQKLTRMKRRVKKDNQRRELLNIPVPESEVIDVPDSDTEKEKDVEDKSKDEKTSKEEGKSSERHSSHHEDKSAERRRSPPRRRPSPPRFRR